MRICTQIYTFILFYDVIFIKVIHGLFENSGNSSRFIVNKAASNPLTLEKPPFPTPLVVSSDI